MPLTAKTLVNTLNQVWTSLARMTRRLILPLTICMLHKISRLSGRPMKTVATTRHNVRTGRDPSGGPAIYPTTGLLSTMMIVVLLGRCVNGEVRVVTLPRGSAPEVLSHNLLLLFFASFRSCFVSSVSPDESIIFSLHLCISLEYIFLCTFHASSATSRSPNRIFIHVLSLVQWVSLLEKGVRASVIRAMHTAVLSSLIEGNVPQCSRCSHFTQGSDKEE